MKILIWGGGAANSTFIQYCICKLKETVCFKKKGGGHDSSAKPEAEGYSGKSSISPVRRQAPRALPDTAQQNCISFGRPDTLKEVYFFRWQKSAKRDIKIQTALLKRFETIKRMTF